VARRPVAVEGVGGTGNLTGVTNLFSDGSGYCALLTSGGLNCWGSGEYGQLGDGMVNDTATPVAVEGVGGIGTLSGVTSITSDQEDSYCALLTSGGLNCWGYGEVGELGDGKFYTSKPKGSATPVAVEGVGGTANLTGLTNLVGGDFVGDFDGGTYCALLTSGGVDCWGYGKQGELGNGTYHTKAKGSASPVAVA